jgi:hypothetical protein
MRSGAFMCSLGFLCSSGCFQDPLPERVAESDRPIVRAALDIYGRRNIPRSLSDSDLAVVHLPKLTCVEIRANSGAPAGDQTMCFDKSRRLVLSYKKDS